MESNQIQAMTASFDVSGHTVTDHFPDVGKMITLDSGHLVSDHFVDVNKMIELGKAEQRMRSEPQISSEHVTNNQAVRETLPSRGIHPESLPSAEDVKKVERRLSAEEKKALKNPDSLENP